MSIAGMRIATKFAVVFSATAGALFSAYGCFAVRSEERELRAAAEREVQRLAQSIELAVENSMHHRQPLEVQELFDRMELVSPELDLLVLSKDGWWRSSDPSMRSLDPALMLLLEAAAAERRDFWESPPPEARERFVLAVPIIAGKMINGAVAIVRPLDDVRADLRRTSLSIWGTMIVAVVVLVLLAVVLANVTLTRPLLQMTAAMKRVRSGDMTASLPTARRDELGATAVEFNAMIADLNAARAVADRELEARRQLQRSLERTDKLATIGQLAAGLAHEIGTPLHVLAGRGRSLAAKSTDANEVRRISNIIVDQAERIARVVEQLLRYARRPTKGLAEIDPREPVRAVLELLEGEARRRNVTLSLHVDPATPRLVASADQLQQVVLNLVRNAIAACGPGATVDVLLAPGATGLSLCVRDTGRGIDPAHVSQLFEPFFTTRSDEGGTGLGLAVVKSIVTEHGGTIEVRARDRGAEFVVELPVLDSSRKEAA